jgi:Zn-finger nucleic acid-binding protein
MPLIANLDRYRSFSQLAADNQYAPLGLALVTVLARLHAILLDILPTPPPVPATSDDLQHGRENSELDNHQHLAPTETEKKPISTRNVGAGTTPVDRGVVVTRSSLSSTSTSAAASNLKSMPSKRKLAVESRSDDSLKRDGEGEKKKKKKKIRDKGDDLSSLFGSLS